MFMVPGWSSDTGLASKNAILIVEFNCAKEGFSITKAALEAATNACDQFLITARGAFLGFGPE